MNIVFATLFISAGVFIVMAIIIESIEMSYDMKCRFKNED